MNNTHLFTQKQIEAMVAWLTIQDEVKKTEQVTLRQRLEFIKLQQLWEDESSRSVNKLKTLAREQMKK